MRILPVGCFWQILSFSISSLYLSFAIKQQYSKRKYAKIATRIHIIRVTETTGDNLPKNEKSISFKLVSRKRTSIITFHQNKKLRFLLLLYKVVHQIHPNSTTKQDKQSII